MLSITITDVKKMTSLLFANDTFDRFLLRDASFNTAISATFSGELNPDFFEESEREGLKDDPYLPWGSLRPVFFQLIKGKRLPLSFKAVLMTNRESTDALSKKCGFTDTPVSSLSMNLSYRDGALFLTTGVAYGGFTLDKSMEKYWDETVMKFLSSKEVSYKEA